MRGILAEVGIADTLLVYNSQKHGNNTIIDGHLRADVDPSIKWPCIVLDVNDEEAEKVLATHDPLASLATIDGGNLDALLTGITMDNPALNAMLEELNERSKLIIDTPPDDFPEVDENIETSHECPKCGYQWSDGT